MKHLAAFLAALVLVLPAFVHGQPGPTAATPARRRPWEDAPAETRALWRRHQQALVRVDLSDDTLPPNFVNFRNWPSIHCLPDRTPVGTTSNRLARASLPACAAANTLH